MTHHSSLVERIGTRPPGDALTCSVRMDEAGPQSRKRAGSSLSGAPRASVSPRDAPENVFFYVDPQGRQHLNIPQRVWLYPSVSMAVTAGKRINLEILAINLLMPLTRERDCRAPVGVTSKRERRLASRFCAECLLTAHSRASVRQRSTPRPLVHSPHLSTRVLSTELSLALLVTPISSLKREAMMAPHKFRLVNFQGAVDSEGGHGQALRRPCRSLPVTAVAKTRGSLPSGAADIGHIRPPVDRVREWRDPRSLSSHAAPCRK